MGETYALSAGIPVVWSSDDEGVAVVDADGVVTAVGEGAATITATSAVNGSRTDTVIVNVTLTDRGSFRWRRSY
ncbi:Ig-like domain-containing protein [Paenibacillus tengchongensis]|uniref:Ig-like domain-containing protein n=1 Tax=Paenibacillus tengchongensis TaxID=2608684 RepID=UPI00124C9066|nr:Ig-like domain-containing protein [Paenibacillus tengchongensis]